MTNHLGRHRFVRRFHKIPALSMARIMSRLSTRRTVCTLSHASLTVAHHLLRHSCHCPHSVSEYNPNTSDNSGGRALHRPAWWQGSRRQDSNGARISRLTVAHIVSQSQMGLGICQGAKCLKFTFPLYQLYECARFEWQATRVSNVMFCWDEAWVPDEVRRPS